MKGVKKSFAASMVIALSIGLLAGCGGVGTNKAADSASGQNKEAASKTNQPAKKIRLFTKSNENNGDFKVMKSIIDDYKKEVNPNFEVEIESVPNDVQYFQKLRTYIAGNQLPEIFKIPNGVLSENLAKQGKLVDIKKTLQEFGKMDQFNKAAIDFLSFKDGSLYLFPEGRYGEAFWYYKKPFEDNNIKVPTTFDEFIQACETLKSKGYTPIAVSGKELWQLVRYLSFIPLRLTHTGFIDQLKVGDISYTSDVGKQSSNLLYNLGKKGYFQKGFSGMDYTQTLNYFLGGNAVIHYNGTWEINQFKDKYDKGEIGYFLLPDVAGAQNIGPKTSITAGLAYGINAKTFDAATKDFFKYLVDHYNQKSYEVGGFISPMNGSVPDSMSKLTKDFSKVLDSEDKGGVSWDDKLDPASNEIMGATANELALGLITPDEFAQKIDKAIKQNAPKFFESQQ
jgi:raffinose/stachyose/melibiose transport system substrate-binding protein